GATFVEARQRRKRALKCILRDVVRELASSHDHVRRAPGSAPVAGKELPRRVSRAVARELNEPGVAAHAHEHIVLRADVLFASPNPAREDASDKHASRPPPRVGLEPAPLDGDASDETTTKV